MFQDADVSRSRYFMMSIFRDADFSFVDISRSLRQYLKIEHILGDNVYSVFRARFPCIICGSNNSRHMCGCRLYSVHGPNSHGKSRANEFGAMMHILPSATSWESSQQCEHTCVIPHNKPMQDMIEIQLASHEQHSNVPYMQLCSSSMSSCEYI